MNADERAMLQRLLTPRTRERLDRITAEHPELKDVIENTLVSLSRAGRRDPPRA